MNLTTANTATKSDPIRGGNPVWYDTDFKNAAKSAPAPEEDTEAPDSKEPRRRRLRDIPRDLQRPLESRLYHLRHVHRWTDAQCSKELDLHRADLNALAATYGEL